MTVGIIICHAHLASEMVSTSEKLFGKAEELYPFSSDFLTPNVLYNQILDQVENKRFSSLIIMVDLRGGNCWKVGMMLRREFPSSKLLSGINIPMLVSFLNKRDKLSLEELAKTMEQDAYRGIVLE